MDMDSGELVEFPVHPFTGLTAIGYTSHGPVWPVMGGAGVGGGDDTEGDDGDEGDEVDDETDGDGEEGEESPAEDWQAKYTELQTQHEAAQAKLQRANAQAKRLREQVKAATPATPAPTPTAMPAKKAAPRAAAAATEVVEPQVVTVQDDSEVERWQARTIRADARSALIARGCDPELVDAPLSRLKVGEIDWDDDEDAPVLDDFIDAMEERYPKLFVKAEPTPTARATPRRPGSIDQGAASTGRPAAKPKSFGEALWESGGGDIRVPRRPRG